MADTKKPKDKQSKGGTGSAAGRAQATEAAPANGLARVDTFDGAPLRSFWWRGSLVWIAAEVGTVSVGYPDPSALPRNITGEWATEFEDGSDYFVVNGTELREFKKLLELTDVSSVTFETYKFAPKLMLLTRDGVNGAILMARTEKGRRFRKLLKTIIAEIQDTGTFTVPGGRRPAPVFDTAKVREIAQGIAVEAVAPITERLEVVYDRLRSLEQRQIPRADSIFCGPPEGARLRAGMRRVAHIRTAHLRPKPDLAPAGWKSAQTEWRREWKRALGQAQRAVQDATSHEGLGKSWDYLPNRDLTVAWETIHRLEAAAEKESRERGSAPVDVQGDLFGNAAPRDAKK